MSTLDDAIKAVKDASDALATAASNLAAIQSQTPTETIKNDAQEILALENTPVAVSTPASVAQDTVSPGHGGPAAVVTEPAAAGGPVDTGATVTEPVASTVTNPSVPVTVTVPIADPATTVESAPAVVTEPAPSTPTGPVATPTTPAA